MVHTLSNFLLINIVYYEKVTILYSYNMLGEPSVTGIHLLSSNLKDIAYIWVEVAKEYYAQQPPPEEDYGDGGSGTQRCNNQCNESFPIATRSEAESTFFEAVVEYISSCR